MIKRLKQSWYKNNNMDYKKLAHELESYVNGLRREVVELRDEKKDMEQFYLELIKKMVEFYAK